MSEDGSKLINIRAANPAEAFDLLARAFAPALERAA